MGGPSINNSKSQVKLNAPTQQEADLQSTQVQLAELQLEQIQRQAELSEFLFEHAPGFFSNLAESDALNLTGDFENLRTASDLAIQQGESDINRRTQLGLEQIRDTLAPERGLRPGDSPILGLGSQVVQAGQHEFGQLSRSVRGREAELRSDLSQRAFQNRLSLAGGATQLGIGLSPNFDVNQARSVELIPRLTQQRTRGRSGGFGEGGGSTGATLGGIGALISAFCWVAAEFYGWGTPEWQNARRGILSWRGPHAAAFRWAYRRWGRRMAIWVRERPWVRWALWPIFRRAERRGREAR